jgi:hypothetical protein
MPRPLRLFLTLVCIVQVIFALGFVFQVPFIIEVWPLPYSDATNLMFIGSIFLAAAASTGWCLLAREDGALAGVALDYIVILTPTLIYGLQLNAERTSPKLVNFIIAVAVGVVFGVLLFLWAVRQPIRPTPPMPLLVRGAFALFVIALVIVGAQLVRQTSGILPWQTTPASVVLYGWMFIGAAAYFAYGLLRPSWRNAGGQLAGFLAYDVVLILPFLGLLGTIAPARMPNLLIYLAVVTLSGVLAIYYLFIHPRTRGLPVRDS